MTTRNIVCIACLAVLLSSATYEDRAADKLPQPDYSIFDAHPPDPLLLNAGPDADPPEADPPNADPPNVEPDAEQNDEDGANAEQQEVEGPIAEQPPGGADGGSQDAERNEEAVGVILLSDGEEDEPETELPANDGVKPGVELGAERGAVGADGGPLDGHMHGVKIERDGSPNDAYLREVLLGQSHEFDLDNQEHVLNLKRRIGELAVVMDTDSDDLVSHAELTSWVLVQIELHFNRSEHLTHQLFASLDADQDLLVSWPEYARALLGAHGMSDWAIEQHLSRPSLLLPQRVKERLTMDEVAFNEQDHDADTRLNQTEFLHFRHPELSPFSFNVMMVHAFDALDASKDGLISLPEYLRAAHPSNSSQGSPLSELYLAERTSDFSEFMDSDRDGHVKLEEFMAFNDPKSRRVAVRDAWWVIAEADEDGDGKLSRREMTDNLHAFLGSRALRPDDVIHNEF